MLVEAWWSLAQSSKNSPPYHPFCPWIASAICFSFLSRSCYIVFSNIPRDVYSTNSSAMLTFIHPRLSKCDSLEILLQPLPNSSSPLNHWVFDTYLLFPSLCRLLHNSTFLEQNTHVFSIIILHRPIPRIWSERQSRQPQGSVSCSKSTLAMEQGMPPSGFSLYPLWSQFLLLRSAKEAPQN